MNILMIIAQCSKALPTPPKLPEIGANDCDVLIAAIVCTAVVLVALITAITISVWHKKELTKNKCSENKGEAKPSQQEIDKKEYIGKLISFREELSKKDSKLNGEGDTACQNYIDLLTYLAKLDIQQQQQQQQQQQHSTT